MQPSQLDFYRSQSRMSAPGPWQEIYPSPSTALEDLVKAVQGSLIHIFWASRYGVDLDEQRKGEVTLRPVAKKLARLQEIAPGPLSMVRPAQQRLVGNCRDFSLLSVSLLRHAGIPARSRCGFGTYFIPGHYEDHWVVEYWQAEQNRWVRLDVQIDELQRAALHLDFEPSDLPEGRFLSGGEAWKIARAGLANPDDFGIFEWKGMDFIKGNLMRDLLALVRFEVLPWDFWGILEQPFNQLSDNQVQLLDRAAEVSIAGELSSVQDLLQANPSFIAP